MFTEWFYFPCHLPSKHSSICICIRSVFYFWNVRTCVFWHNVILAQAYTFRTSATKHKPVTSPLAQIPLRRKGHREFVADVMGTSTEWNLGLKHAHDARAAYATAAYATRGLPGFCTRLRANSWRRLSGDVERRSSLCQRLVMPRRITVCQRRKTSSTFDGVYDSKELMESAPVAFTRISTERNRIKILKAR